MLFTILQFMGWAPLPVSTTENHLLQNVQSAKVEKPWFKPKDIHPVLFQEM